MDIQDGARERMLAVLRQYSLDSIDSKNCLNALLRAVDEPPSKEVLAVAEALNNCYDTMNLMDPVALAEVAIAALDEYRDDCNNLIGLIRSLLHGFASFATGISDRRGSVVRQADGNAAEVWARRCRKLLKLIGSGEVEVWSSAHDGELENKLASAKE